jgi:hypothetical protein
VKHLSQNIDQPAVPARHCSVAPPFRLPAASQSTFSAVPLKKAEQPWFEVDSCSTKLLIEF